MLCEVIFLRRNGKRLKKQELDKPITSLLEVQDWTRRPNEVRRHLRVANLYSMAGKAKAITASIFDPEVVMTTADGFVLRGNETVLTDKGKQEVLQMWLCRPAVEHDSLLPRFIGSVTAFGPP